MSSGRTTDEQKSAEEFHVEKCCTTKYMCWGIVTAFLGVTFLITCVGVYDAWYLNRWAGAQYQESCYVFIDHFSTCNTESCTGSSQCTQNSYVVTPVAEFTVAEDECTKWDNGCCAILFVSECAKQHEYGHNTTSPCYAYSIEDNQCNDAGKLDKDNTWRSQRTIYIVMMVLAILFLIASVVLFVLGFIRCVFKEVKDDILGDTKGTGCYWCHDYERCCYGEAHGHATVVNPSGRNLPVKDKKREGPKKKTKKKKRRRESSDESSDYDEEQELR
eukprot:171538_1